MSLDSKDHSKCYTHMTLEDSLTHMSDTSSERKAIVDQKMDEPPVSTLMHRVTQITKRHNGHL